MQVGPRLFLDEHCVQNQIPMLDTGMMGSLGSVQVRGQGKSATPTYLVQFLTS